MDEVSVEMSTQGSVIKDSKETPMSNGVNNEKKSVNFEEEATRHILESDEEDAFPSPKLPLRPIREEGDDHYATDSDACSDIPSPSPGDMNGRLKSDSSGISQDELFATHGRRQSIFQKIIHPIIRYDENANQRKRSRLVSKEGTPNIKYENISHAWYKYFLDIFNTLLDLKWRYLILVFTISFQISWLLFALIYYIIIKVHKDDLHVGEDEEVWKPCLYNVYDFTTAFLFSLETQHTIGYGFRGMTDLCPPAMIALAAQSCMGVFFQCIVTGLVFAKLSRPKRRGRTIMFSSKAVICKRDNEYQLMFRVGDMRKSHMVMTTIRGVMIQNHVTQEGELIPLCQTPMQLQTETTMPGDNFVFLMWPVTCIHRINESSPLWKISKDQLESGTFEIIIIFEGTVTTTGMSLQVKTSYIPEEIIWGHRLAPLLTYKEDTGGYRICHKDFNETIPTIGMPTCSALDYAKLRRRDSDSKNKRFSDFTAEHVDSPNTIKKNALAKLLKQKKYPLKRFNTEPTINVAKLKDDITLTYTPPLKKKPGKEAHEFE